MTGLVASALDAIGATPLVALDRLTQGLDGRIVAKLEFFNPGLSKKDRIARRIIEDARANGDLAPGQTVVELTSGSTGVGAAIVCAVLGHPFVAVMSAGNSPERAQMMRAYGAEVVIVDQARGGQVGQVSGDDLARVEARTIEIVARRNAFRIDQFHRAGSRTAHEDGTGAEIWAQSGGSVTAFCDFVGSGGAFAGVSRALHARNPRVRAYVVEPAGAQALAGGAVTRPNHRIQGGGYAMPHLPLLQDARIDGFLAVDDEDARNAARYLARVEGILGGYSAGANVAAALRLLEGPERGGVVAILICDSGLKYASTDLYD
ncbi:MAG: cysteine synthase family protein [Hyphomonadaceae bacterium]|nr:cysteine synthase family protein [Hyphomonadaceae bacterium]